MWITACLPGPWASTAGLTSRGLVEIDARTGFTERLTHAGGMASRPPDLRRNLLYVIIAEATSMGLSAMAESCGVSCDTLAWTAEWYFSEETLEAANAAIVNYHHQLPMPQSFGTGTLSSSDGQKFPVKGKSLTAAHVSDQHASFDTKVITSTSPESPYVLDGILGSQTDLLITEHATDTSGTWARSPSTAPGREPTSPPATRPPGTCSPAG